MAQLNYIFKSVIKCFSTLVLVISIIVLIRTITFGERKQMKNTCSSLDSDFISADEKLLQRFQEALKFKTISTNRGDARVNKELQDELQKIANYIKQTYRQIHNSPLVTREVVGNYSLLYTVKGSDPTLKPYLLMGHLDVVPVPDQDKWESPAFEGLVKDGFIYGRGTIDDKHNVFGMLEAVEHLLTKGFSPKRQFYMAFGHDEEVEGSGADAIGQLLSARGVELEFILDEGTAVINDIMPGFDKPFALVGTSEKGWLTLKLSVNASGGHSSMPEPESCIGILATAIARLEANPHPNMFGTGVERQTLEHAAPYMALPLKILFTNLWLFGPIISRLMSYQPALNAFVRTTTAITVFKAGVKINVIPTSASALVNHRVHPEQTIQEVIAFDRDIINDNRVTIEVRDVIEPHPISPSGDDSFGYQTIKTSILQLWGAEEVAVAPGVMTGNTDTKSYLHLTKSVYRFSPTYMFPEDLKRFHGRNERISVKNYQQVMNFFYHVVRNADKEKLDPKHEHGEEL